MRWDGSLKVLNLVTGSPCKSEFPKKMRKKKGKKKGYAPSASNSWIAGASQIQPESENGLQQVLHRALSSKKNNRWEV
jgi:hypothetical protein